MTGYLYDYNELSLAEEMYVNATNIYRYKTKVAEKARQRLDEIDAIASPASDLALLALIDWLRKDHAAMQALHWENLTRNAAAHAQ